MGIRWPGLNVGDRVRVRTDVKLLGGENEWFGMTGTITEHEPKCAKYPWTVKLDNKEEAGFHESELEHVD